MKELFRNTDLNRQFADQGFVKTSFLNRDEVAALHSVFEQTCDRTAPLFDRMYFSLIANSPKLNLNIREGVMNIFQGGYQRVFQNYRSVAESFLSKFPGVDGDLWLHQDWNYVDEKKYSSATVWCPLTDINSQNGSLYVLRGSHRFFNLIRSASFPTSRIKGDGLLREHLEHLEVKAGEAVIFHQALWHGSRPNLSYENRIIATSIILEDDAQFVYFDKTEQLGRAAVYPLDDSVFMYELKTLAEGEKPQNTNPISSILYEHRGVEESELLSKVLSMEKLNEN